MHEIQVPGKVFLMGEYSVLNGSSALLAATAPGFVYSVNDGTEIQSPEESPLGKFLSAHPSSPRIKSKSKGLGLGFGSSTAELIAETFFAREKLPITSELWAWYRTQFPQQSGADLATQCEGLLRRHPLFEVSEFSKVAKREISPLFSQIYVFQVNESEKIATHVSLKEKRPAIAPESANALVHAFIHSLEEADEEALVLLSTWAEFLAGYGLETEKALVVRTEFEAIPGVLGVKGCGAGMNDVFLVGVQSSFKTTASLERTANFHRLKSLGTLEALLWK